MRQKIVIGNWKMNGTREKARELVLGIAAEAPRLANKLEMVVCPPYTMIGTVSQAVQGHEIKVGAQDVSLHQDGAYTGQVSAKMLVDCQCSYVIIGHSERRQYCHETNDEVAKKFVVAQQAGLIPVLCLGETLMEHESGHTHAVVSSQLQAVIDLAGVEAFKTAIVAYEPVWAIGTGQTATPEQVIAVHQLLRDLIMQASEDVGQAVRIVYGGSVKPDNAKTLFSAPDIDGGLVGGASLKAKDYIKICEGAIG